MKNPTAEQQQQQQQQPRARHSRERGPPLAFSCEACAAGSDPLTPTGESDAAMAMWLTWREFSFAPAEFHFFAFHVDCDVSGATRGCWGALFATAAATAAE